MLAFQTDSKLVVFLVYHKPNKLSLFGGTALATSAPEQTYDSDGEPASWCIEVNFNRNFKLLFTALQSLEAPLPVHLCNGLKGLGLDLDASNRHISD